MVIEGSEKMEVGMRYSIPECWKNMILYVKIPGIPSGRAYTSKKSLVYNPMQMDWVVDEDYWGKYVHRKLKW